MAEMMVASQEAMAQGQPEPQVDVEARVAQLIAEYTQEVMSALLPPPEGEIDPLVQLRSKELDIKAADMARKADEFSTRIAFEKNREKEQQEITREKIDSSEDVALLRADVNMERINKMGKEYGSQSPGRGE